MAGNSINNTTIWTPQGGFDQGWAKTGVQSGLSNPTPAANPWGISDPNNPGGTIQDPSATGTPTAFSNAAGTTGILNPFGLTQNQPNFGYFGQNQAPAPTSAPPTPQPAAQGPPTGQTWNDGTFINGQWQTFNPPDAQGVTPDPTLRSNDPGGVAPGRTPMTNGFGGGGSGVRFSNNPLAYRPGQNFSGNTDGPLGQPGNSNLPPGAQPGVNGYMANGQWIPFSGQGIGAPNYAAPAQTGPTNQNNTEGGGPAPSQQPANINKPSSFGFQQGVTSGYLDANGQQQQAPTNSLQFGDNASSQSLAKQLGGNVWGLQLGGPGNGFSSPQNMIGFNGNTTQGINAGLAGDVLNKYGNSPGSYGNFLLARDKASLTGQPFADNYQSWASSNGLINPNLGNSGPTSQDTAFAQSQQNAQQAPSPQQAQQQFQQQQQATASNNIYSQLAPILSFLQQLGLGGGQQQQNSGNSLGSLLQLLLGGGQGGGTMQPGQNMSIQQQQPYHRPPQFNGQSYQGSYGFPYYSKFA